MAISWRAGTWFKGMACWATRGAGTGSSCSPSVSRPLLDHVGLLVDAGERVCVVGRNGEGKSSLLRLARAQPPDDGEVCAARRARRLLVRDVDAVDDARVADVVAGGPPPDAGEHWETAHRVDTVIRGSGFDAEALRRAWRLAARVLLGRALVAGACRCSTSRPTTRHRGDQWLESVMLQFRGALLFVSRPRSSSTGSRPGRRARSELAQLPAPATTTFEQKKALQLENEARRNALFDKRLRRREGLDPQASRRGARNGGRAGADRDTTRSGAERRERIGQADMGLQEARASGKLVFEAEGRERRVRRAHRDPRLLGADRARRPHRYRRAQRRGQRARADR